LGELKPLQNEGVLNVFAYYNKKNPNKRIKQFKNK
jgi:hypothetical protein